MSSKIKRNLLLLLAVILLVGLVVLLPNRNQSRAVKSVVFPAVTDNIDRIDFKGATNQYQINLVDGNWQLGKEGFPVLKDKVANIITSIENPRKAELVSVANVYEPYGLDDETKLEIIFYSSDRSVKKITIGNSANQFNTLYGSEDDDSYVYQIALDRYNLVYPEQDLIDKKIFNFSSAQAVELSITDKKKPILVLKRPPENLAVENTNIGSPPERNWVDTNGTIYPKENINDIVNYLSILNANKVISPEKKYQNFNIGSTDTLRTLKVILENGNNYVLTIAERKGNEYYVIADNRKFHYFISELEAKNLLVLQEDLKVLYTQNNPNSGNSYFSREEDNN